VSKGIYVALSGAVAQQNALDATASNVANASTAGYQRLRPIFREALQNATGNQDPKLRYGSVDRNAVDTTPGAIRKTDRALDVALPDGGYLALATIRGERYTRSGSLNVTKEGALVTPSNVAVAGESGEAIKVDPAGGPVTIDPDGAVKQNGAAVAKLRVVTFEQPDALSPEGAGVLTAVNAGAITVSTKPLEVGALEDSNAQPVTEMTELMTATRNFDAFQKVLDTLGDVDHRLLTTVPNPGDG
jgi:flagellar basal body rod protein FlgG